MIADFATIGRAFESEVDLTQSTAKFAKNNQTAKIIIQIIIFVAKAIKSFTIKATLLNQIAFAASMIASSITYAKAKDHTTLEGFVFDLTFLSQISFRTLSNQAPANKSETSLAINLQIK